MPFGSAFWLYLNEAMSWSLVFVPVCVGIAGVDPALCALFSSSPSVAALLALKAGEMAPASSRAGFVPPC